MRKMGRITAGLVMAVMLMTACNKNTGTVAETSGENLVSTEAQETETTTKADVKETTTAKETTKSSTKASKTDETTTAAKKNTETTTAQETTSAKAVVTETTTAQETTSARAVVTETTTQAQETTTAQPETTTQAPTEAPAAQPETTTQAPTEAPATQPETTTQAPTEAPTQAPTEAPTTQPETTTEAPTEAPTEAGPKSDEELLAEISDPHYGTRAEVNGNVYWYSGGWKRSQGAWNGPSLNSIMGDVRNGMEVYATENGVLNDMNDKAAQYLWSTTGEDLGWYDEGYVTHEWTYCNDNPCEWHNH